MSLISARKGEMGGGDIVAKGTPEQVANVAQIIHWKVSEKDAE